MGNVEAELVPVFGTLNPSTHGVSGRLGRPGILTHLCDLLTARNTIQSKGRSKCSLYMED